MQEVEIIGTFESEETARSVAKALNAFFRWVMDDEADDDEKDFFGDFGVAFEDFVPDREDIDWPEAPRARVRGPRVSITAETAKATDALQELLEALGAFDVSHGEDDEDADD